MTDFMNLCPKLLDMGIELVVVDDGSTDGSTGLLKNLAAKFPSILFFDLKINQGSANARNKGVEACTRDYIFFLDIDDSCNLVALRKSLLEISKHQCNFLIANLQIKPQNQLINMPVNVPFTTKFEMRHIAPRILEIMGYSRFIYSRTFLVESLFRFFPTRPESHSNNFILDDAFWLLLIASSDSTVLVCERERVIYYYNKAPVFSESWDSYLSQLKLIPHLTILFLNTFLNNSFLNSRVLVEITTRWMFAVLRPLDLKGLISSGLFSTSILFPLLRLIRLRGVSNLNLMSLYFSILFTAMKNSLRIRTRIRKIYES